ncbi:DNA-formamidopyrimidine glycosylase family protein [Isoptericola sp. AK164]|uniref:DNA-formamidopyrimidine glycosylase family protein n=1 Tax=Isoptericola sp. AK164 TaxID=3024246 RepID=UPI0024186BC1|nr:DNA-formamidopyrimidine glycosylase family protein [Isoptericola sp. AK164]
MPEGDVLRLTAERLDQALRGGPLVRAELRWPNVGGAELTGRTVTGCVSYGKHLLTRFDDGRTLHTHLRMEGAWRVVPTDGRTSAAGHPQVRAVLSTARWTAVGWRLGMLDLLRTRDEPRLLAHLGPDVLADDFGTHGLPEALDRWHAQGDRPLCDVLLDQAVVAGLGTIWMAESLFARRLHPWIPADSLSEDEVRGLLVTARRLVGGSVEIGRRRDLGEVPRSVHGRLGRPCRRCRTPIAVGQANEPPYERPVFWCPTCQAVSRPA